jgi:hypothetical protein
MVLYQHTIFIQCHFDLLGSQPPSMLLNEPKLYGMKM